MPVPRIDQIRVLPEQRTSLGGSRLFREWCFLRVLVRHFRVRFFLMALILLGGGLLFVYLEPEKQHTLLQGVFYAWQLIFGEKPEELPESNILRALFFIMPVLGLTVIIEGIIDFALTVRERRRYERSWCAMLAASYNKHIVLVGFGKLGYGVFRVLRKLGEAVVVIEKDSNNQFLEELRRDGSPLLVGDARRDALLVEANIAKAKSIILASNDDLANLEIALDAQRMSPGIRVVLRMFEQTIADKMASGFNIHLAMSQSALSAPTFATTAVAPGIISSFVVGNQLVAMQRWLVRAGGPFAGKTVREVSDELGVAIAEHSRPGSAAQSDPRLFPKSDTTLEPGDGIVVQGPLKLLTELWQRNMPEERKVS